MQCVHCGSNYNAGDAFCPNCGTRLPVPGEPYSAKPAKAPIYKKWWFWVLCLVALSCVFSAIESLGNSNHSIDTPPVLTEPDRSVLPTPEPEYISETIGQKNALRAAISYISIMPFSYTGLIEQLEYENYSHEDAVYGADNCGANWSEQAAKSAKQYLELMAFSRESLIEQLEYEGYTHEQAVYGVEANGY